MEIGDVKTVFTVTQETKPVIKEDKEDVIDLCDSDDDDEIEMVAVVTNDNKKFKCIKLEDQEDNKKRKWFNFFWLSVFWRVFPSILIFPIKSKVCFYFQRFDEFFSLFSGINQNIVHATGTLLSDRISQHYKDTEKRLNFKSSLVNPRVLKGHIDHQKYEKYKRTIEDGPETVADTDSSPVKKPKFEPRVQVEITNFPPDWKENELNKVTNIINAYGQDGEQAFEEIKESNEGKTLVVILKKPYYAQKLYESMNNRVLDECTIQVSEPHPKE